MMLELPLQSFDLETLSLARQLSEILTVALGLAISYIAYRGYRRNGSRAMLFVAAGFVLVVGVPALVTVVLYLVLDLPIPVVNSVGQVSELAGMAAILYGLWTPRGG
ncbi:DUF7521 family protein [Haloarchaeobius baliensis]|uniref:DUF7521 family protein n=1 Tax=Haloarchaeobius baliensis TaxID=1670458 RepID=UPI003F884A75